MCKFLVIEIILFGLQMCNDYIKQNVWRLDSFVLIGFYIFYTGILTMLSFKVFSNPLWMIYNSYRDHSCYIEISLCIHDYIMLCD